MKHNKWKDELYELSGGSDDYGDCTVYVKEAIPFISSLLKKQREEQVKEVGTLLVVDVEQEIKPYDAQLIMEMKANHNEMVRKYNLAITKVLSILKGNKK